MEENGQELKNQDDFLEGWEDDAPDIGDGDSLPDQDGDEADCPPMEDRNPLQGFAPPGELEMRSDILEFARCFPDAALDPGSIPPAVWEQVGQGRSLTVAYGQWALEQERGRRFQAEQNDRELQRIRRNGLRSTGSMRTSGDGSRRRDPFLEGWGE